MTVYLRGLNGRLDQVEKNVESISIDNDYIKIKYKQPYKWGIVSGVAYFANEMVISKVEG